MCSAPRAARCSRCARGSTAMMARPSTPGAARRSRHGPRRSRSSRRSASPSRAGSSPARRHRWPSTCACRDAWDSCGCDSGATPPRSTRTSKLIDGRAGARFVKNRNKKGGSSSNRFRRRRSEQARDLHDRAAELADELLAPWQAGLDWLVIAGDRLALAAVEERSLVLPRIEAPREVAMFHLGDPRSSLLEGVARELWSSTIRRPERPEPS